MRKDRLFLYSLGAGVIIYRYSHVIQGGYFFTAWRRWKIIAKPQHERHGNRGDPHRVNRKPKK